MNPVTQGLAARMGGGGAPPPPAPAGPAGPPPQGPPGMGGPPGGGDVVGQVAELLQQALMLTVQAGPEAFGAGGLKEVWRGAFGMLDQKMAPMRQALGGNPQMGMPGQGGPPPGMPPGPPPQMGP